MKNHKFNMVGLSKLAKPSLYATVIILNIIVLTFVFRSLTNKIRKTESLLAFKWGEQALELPTTCSISGDTVGVLKGKHPLTVMVFFDSLHADQIRQIDLMRNHYMKNKNLKMIGIFLGNNSEGGKLINDYDIHMPVIADPEGEIYRRFRFHVEHKNGGTMIVDDSLKVRLYFRSIISENLLEQFINRKFQAFEHSPEN